MKQAATLVESPLSYKQKHIELNESREQGGLRVEFLQ